MRPAQSLRLAHTVCTVVCVQRKMETRLQQFAGRHREHGPNAGCMSLSADTLALETGTPPADQRGIRASTTSSFWCLLVSLVKDQHGPEAASEKSFWPKASVDLFLHASPRAASYSEALPQAPPQQLSRQERMARGCSEDCLGLFLQLENTVFLLR